MDEKIEDILHREHLSLAANYKRAVAFFIDEMLLSFLLIFAMYERFASAQSVEEMILLTNSFVFEYMVMKILYQTIFVTLYGATLGKMVMKIRVISVLTLDKPTLPVALNRAIFRIISEMLFYLGFLWGMMDPNHQTWHDKTAKTLVVDA